MDPTALWEQLQTSGAPELNEGWTNRGDSHPLDDDHSYAPVNALNQYTTVGGRAMGYGNNRNSF